MAEAGARRRFVLLPVQGMRASSPGVTRAAGSFLLSLTRHVGARVRPIGDMPQVELKVVDSVSDDGPKLVEVSPEAGIALRSSRPDLRLVPLVYYQSAVAPRVLPRAEPQLATAEPTQPFSVTVVSRAKGTPQAGCTVVVFTDSRGRRGAQRTTDAAGQLAQRRCLRADAVPGEGQQSVPRQRRHVSRRGAKAAHLSYGTRLLRGEARGIASLPRRFDGAGVVVPTHEGHHLVGRDSVDDGETGQGRAGSPTTGAAGDLDALVPGSVPGLGEDVLRLRAVAGQPEVRPAQPPALPWGARR